MPQEPTPADLIASLPPELLKKLISVASEVERGRILDSQLATMSLENQERMTRNREAYRDKHATSFDSFNWKASLVGAPGQEYAYSLLGMTFFLRPPPAKITRAAQAMASSDAGKALQPITADEFRLLGWVSGVQVAGGARIALTDHGDPEDQLLKLREISDVLLSKVAGQAETLETWLNVQLELDGGKS